MTFTKDNVKPIQEALLRIYGRVFDQCERLYCKHCKSTNSFIIRPDRRHNGIRMMCYGCKTNCYPLNPEHKNNMNHLIKQQTTL